MVSDGAQYLKCNLEIWWGHLCSVLKWSADWVSHKFIGWYICCFFLLPPWLPATAHCERPDGAERNLEVIQTQQEKVAYLDVWEAWPRPLTLLVGIYFIYGTPLLIVKLNINTCKKTFFFCTVLKQQIRKQ